MWLVAFYSKYRSNLYNYAGEQEHHHTCIMCILLSFSPQLFLSPCIINFTNQNALKWLAISAPVIVLTFGAQHLIRYELVKLVGQHIFILISSECPEKISELLVFFIPIAIVTGSTIQCFNVNQHTYE